MKLKATRRALLMSVLSLLLCASMLIGTTFAWFTDSVTSAGNIIKSGTLDVTMEWADGKNDPATTAWTDASQGAIFDYDLWEPGYTEVRHVKIENVGNLALKYQLNILANGEVSKLADVIDVYYVDPAVQVADRAALASAPKLGTLSQVLANISTTASGNLLPDEAHTITIALKMQESAGNEYQNLAIGTDFSVQLLATQLTSESDSFGSDYDKKANIVVPVSNLDEFLNAIKNGNDMDLQSTIVIDEAFMINANKRSSLIDTNAVIDGNGTTIFRSENMADKPIFEVTTGYTLTLSNITVDGGAVWSGTVDADLRRGTENTGLKTTANLIKGADNSHIVLNSGAILQNNDGASAIYPSFKSDATVTLNGGWILNNNGNGGGAIWGGGHITVNAGSKINGNTSTSIGGAIRMVSGRNFTMTGGEMNYNKAATNGGAIWGGGSRSAVCTYVISGGEMAYNTAEAGGAIWTGNYEKYTISGNFELHDNSAALLGGAIRFCDHTSLTMEGGKVYNNSVAGESEAFFLNNNTASLAAGTIEDNFSYSGGLGLTLGEANIQGVINFNLGTVHNTVYLAAEFNGVEFTVEESATNFANFNFKPAAGYTYTAGDEAKLVCLNEGYSTYWDAATGTFRLQAN